LKIERYREAYKLIQNSEVVCLKKTPRSFYFSVGGEDVILTHYWDESGDRAKEIYEHQCTCKEQIFPVGKMRECKHILAAKVALTAIYGPALRKRWTNLVNKSEDLFKMMNDKQKKEYLERCGLETQAEKQK